MLGHVQNKRRIINLIVTASLIFCASCRIGNSVQTAENPDHTTGYYLAEPHLLKFYVTTSDTASKEAPINLIPAEVSSTISNPVALIMRNPADVGRALLVSAQDVAKGGSVSGLPVDVGSNNSLYFKGTTKAAIFWRDPECLSSSEWTLSGTLTRNSRLPAPVNVQLPIAGEIELKVQVVYQFQGNCVPTFQALADCYMDSTKCGGSTASENLKLQTEVVDSFDPFIQSKVITASDIPNIVNFAYEVSYQ